MIGCKDVFGAKASATCLPFFINTHLRVTPTSFLYKLSRGLSIYGITLHPSFFYIHINSKEKLYNKVSRRKKKGCKIKKHVRSRSMFLVCGELNSLRVPELCILVSLYAHVVLKSCRFVSLPSRVSRFFSSRGMR